MTTVLTRDERQLLVAARRHLRADGWTLYSGGARHDGAHLDAEWAYEWNVDGKYGRILEIRLLTKHGSTRRIALTADVDSVQEAIDLGVVLGLLSQGMSAQYKAGLESGREEKDDQLVNAILDGMPESWDQDAAAESIAIDYVRELERRVKAFGGTLERYGCDECAAEPGETHRSFCPNDRCDPTTDRHSTPHKGCILR